MGIDTNTLALGGSMPAKSGFSARAPGSNATNGSDDPNTDPTQGSGSAQASNSPDTDGTSASGQKATGPSAQTRNAQAPQARSNPRTTRSRANAADSTSSQASPDTQDATPESSGDFGSVMASALGRGAANTTGSIAAAAITRNSNSPTATTPAQQAPAAPTDAVAWIAQALMPHAALAQAVTDAAEPADAAAPGSYTIGSGAAGNAASTTGLAAALGSTGANVQNPSTLAAQLATQTGAATQVPVPAAQQAQVAQADAAAISAAAALTAGNVNALADVQKLISGLTDAHSTDTDTDVDSVAPRASASTDSDSTDAAEAAAALQASALTHPSSLGAATLTIHAPVGSAAFANEVSSQVTGLAQSGITQAQLQLNPADLGPVQVHITMQAGQASVWFGATHADTRAALEQSLPRLRELFNGAGMPLTDSGVFREPPQQQQAQSLPASSSSRSTLGDTAVAPSVTQVANIRLSLLDTYA